MKIKSVVIVGGGTSGWMTASIFAKVFKDDINVTIVESPTIPKVGVGESTIIQFNEFLKQVGLEDSDWMKECNATYKNSIKFTDFSWKGDDFQYPFGGSRAPQSIFGWAQLAAKYKLPKSSFCQFMNPANYLLAEENKQCDNRHKVLKNYDFGQDTAYHFDAELFAKYLKDNVCLPNDVVHVLDDIVGVHKDDDGYVTSVIGNDGEYSADLFIDCSGFNSILLEKEMGSEFLSFKPWLSNDRAYSAHIPYTDKETQLTNVTECTAIENGWVWNIPLWNRMGTGYVYSSEFVDDETALKEFKNHLGVEDVEVNKINIRHGIRRDGWVKNVVGVGLAYAFVEPLESTTLVSTHQVLAFISELLERRECNISRFDIDGYNQQASQVLLGFRDFVCHHYALSSRDDTPYWKYHTQEKDYRNVPDDQFYPVHLESGGTTFKNAYEMLLFFHQFEHVWDIQHIGAAYILSGMGYKPMSNNLLDWVRNSNPETDKNLQAVYDEWTQDYINNQKYVDSLQSSTDFLKEHIYGFE
tara:strand:- start:164 stop:1741 length:1578 start_codon:yes stop_codon:yes gene_type:complete